jgi:hypothetical protein
MYVNQLVNHNIERKMLLFGVIEQQCKLEHTMGVCYKRTQPVSLSNLLGSLAMKSAEIFPI